MCLNLGYLLGTQIPDKFVLKLPVTPRNWVADVILINEVSMRAQIRDTNSVFKHLPLILTLAVYFIILP